MSVAAIKLLVAFGVLVVAGAGAVANALWGPKARARKRLDGGRQTQIADREIVTLTGKVRGTGELLAAPMSGKPCVMYEVVGRLYKPGYRNRPELDAQVSERKLIAFELDTAGGVVRVEGEWADFEVPRTPVIPRRLARERAFLEAHGRPPQRDAAFEEAAVFPGDTIRVQGMAIVEIDAAAPDERGFREEAPRRIRIVAHDEHPLTIGRARR